MENSTSSVATLIAVLQTLPPNAPVYMEGGDGNSLPWNGIASLFPHKHLDVTTDSSEPVVKLTIGDGSLTV